MDSLCDSQPLGMEAAGPVHAFVGVCPKVVALRLEQVGGQPLLKPMSPVFIENGSGGMAKIFMTWIQCLLSYESDRWVMPIYWVILVPMLSIVITIPFLQRQQKGARRPNRSSGPQIRTTRSSTIRVKPKVPNS